MRRCLIFVLFGLLLFSYVQVGWASEEGVHKPSVEAVDEHKASYEEHGMVHGGHVSGEEQVVHGVHPHVTKKQVRNLLWWTVNFILLIVILVKFGRKPTADAFRARREAIENEYKELEAKRVEAEARYQEYEKKLATLEEEAKSIMETFIDQGKREKDRIIREAYETADRIKQQAEFYVQQELEKARESLRREVAELSVKLAEQIIREKITPEDQRRLVQEFIERVVH